MKTANASLAGLRYYLFASTGLHLLWEIVQIPLYTIWKTGTNKEIAFAILHCTAGDAIIAITALVIALVVFNKRDWPVQASVSFNTFVVLAGLIYTIFSERMNLASGAWAYADPMPVIPWFDVGLSPVMQWLAVPAMSLCLLRRLTASPQINHDT